MRLLTELPAPMAPTFVAVRSVEPELPEDTFTLELEAPPGFSFAPGQFTMLYAFGIGEVPVSVSGDPANTAGVFQTIRTVGAVTSALGRLEPGDQVGVRGPFGNAWPMDEAAGSDLVIVAGGIGLAPLRPAIYHALANRDRYRRLVLLYGARSPSELLYVDEIQEWRGRLDADVRVTVDGGGPGWFGSVGVVTELVTAAPFDPEQTVAFVCGPEIMMRFTRQTLEEQGVASDRTYVSMERNMKCGIGLCGHCQFGPVLVCRDGPIYSCGDSDLCWLKEV